MNDLGPEARSLLEAARGADAPTRADRARIKHAVALRVATVGAASMAAGGAAAMTLATKVTVAALTVAVLGGGSASLWAWKAHRAAPPAALHQTAPRRSASRTPPALAARPSAEASVVVEEPPPKPLAAEAPAVVEEPRRKPFPPEARRREVVRGEARTAETARVSWVASAPVPSRALESLDPVLTGPRRSQEELRVEFPAQEQRRLAEYPAQPVAPPAALAVVEEPRLEVRRREVVRGEARPAEAASVPVVPRSPAPRPALDSLDPELTLLRQAQDELRAGLPAQALRRLDEYDRRFGKGTMNEERRAIGAIALCQAHPGPAAQAQAERFLRTAPQSPLAGRVRSACHESAETAKQSNEIAPNREP
jgi:hypothetical protein